MTRTAVVLAGIALVLASCGSADDRDLVVSTAASLQGAFADLELLFEDQHPGIDVVLNTGGSSTLREQILAGAPVDVFASANESVMATVVDAGLTAGPVDRFAVNRLVIAVPVGNEAGVMSLTDLADPSLLVGLCAAPVPCGSLAATVLADAGVIVEPDTREPDVRALRTKIELGELDAGLVYASDAATSDAIDAISTGSDATTTYTIVVLVDSRLADDARAFVELVLSPTGQAALTAAGFSSP